MKPTFSVFNITVCCRTTADTRAASANTFSVNVPARDHLLSLGKLEWLLPCPAKDDVTFCKLVESSVLNCTCRDKQFDGSLLWNIKPRTGGFRRKKSLWFEFLEKKKKSNQRLFLVFLQWQKQSHLSKARWPHQRKTSAASKSGSSTTFWKLFFCKITSLMSLTVWKWGSLC